MANFSKILGLASTAVVFAGMAFGQTDIYPSCGTAQPAFPQAPLIRVEGTTELVGEYVFSCGTANTVSASATIMAYLSLPVTSKILTSSNGTSEAVAVVTSGDSTTEVLGTYSGSVVTFLNVQIPAGVSQVNIGNIRVNGTSLSVGSGTPPPVTESAFVTINEQNQTTIGSVPGSVTVAYGFNGLGSQTVYSGIAEGSSTAWAVSGKGKWNTFLICQTYKPAALASVIDVSEGFAAAFKAEGSSNPTLGSEFFSNTETGITGLANSTSNVANTPTMLQVTFTGIPAQVSSLFVPITIDADASLVASPTAGLGTLTLVASPSSLTMATAATGSTAPTFYALGVSGTNASTLTITNGSATAYYAFTPGANSTLYTEAFSIQNAIYQTANATGALPGTMTATVSFAPTGSTQIPNFVVGSSSVANQTVATFSICQTSLLFPFVTNQLGFDTGIAIANTSTDPFGSSGATPQGGNCTLNFYGAGAPSPANVTTATIPTATVDAFTLSSVAPGFQGYVIAVCNYQFAHGFAFITDGVGANGGLSQGYLAGVLTAPGVARAATESLGF